MRMLPGELAREIKDFEIVMVRGKMANLEVQPTILEDIKKAWEEDEYLTKKPKKVNLRSHLIVQLGLR